MWLTFCVAPTGELKEAGLRQGQPLTATSSMRSSLLAWPRCRYMEAGRPKRTLNTSTAPLLNRLAAEPCF